MSFTRVLLAGNTTLGKSAVISFQTSAMEGDGWANQILDNVHNVPIQGTPGTIVVYGNQAMPILTNAAGQVLIAAAEYGQGRLVVFSHDAYASQDKVTGQVPAFEKLYSNIKQWVTKGKFTDNSRIVLAKDIKSHIPEDAVLLWGTLDTLSSTVYEKMLTFLHDGGAVIVAMTPWGFLQLRPQFSLKTMPMNRFIMNAGMCFTEECLSSSDSIDVAESCPQSSHFKTTIDDLITTSNMPDNFTKDICYLPFQQLPYLKEKLLDIIEHCQSDTHCCPCPENPVTSQKEKTLVVLIDKALELYGCTRCSEKVPSVINFPGEIHEDVPLQSATVEIAVPKHHDYCVHPTGYYVPPGKELLVTLHQKRSPEQGLWSVAIGSHTDNLTGVDEPWRRWPNVCTKTVLNEQKTSLRTPTGGSVYFISHQDCKTPMNAVIQNVVQAPYFDISIPHSKSKWLERRNSPGLWADLVGNRIMLSVPAASVRNLEDPEAVVTLWDRIVETHYSLAGADLDADKRRRQWVVTDEQPSAGYMHSGYPVVTHLDVADVKHVGPHDVSLLNVHGLTTKGSWGMFHELGHNLQDPMWTFAGTIEVTCNIFTLHAMDVICGQKPWIHSWLSPHLPRAKKYLKEGAQFVLGWQNNPEVALFIYAQLARDFGWDAYRKVFEEYRNLKGPERPHNLQSQIDQWIGRFSKVAGQNLCPLFHLWGFPISAEVRDSLVDLPLYIPADEIANMVPERVDAVVKLYK